MLLYVYSSGKIPLIKELMLSMWPTANVVANKPRLFCIRLNATPEQPLSAFRELIMNDADVNLTLALMPEKTQAILTEEWVEKAIRKLPYSNVSHEFLAYHVVKNYPNARTPIRKNIDQTMEKHLKDTVLSLAKADLNASIAAKKLYVHRNTLLYRVHTTREKTGIDPQSFLGAAFFHILYTV